MRNLLELKPIIESAGLTLSQVARILNISPSLFSIYLHSGCHAPANLETRVMDIIRHNALIGPFGRRRAEAQKTQEKKESRRHIPNGTASTAEPNEDGGPLP